MLAVEEPIAGEELQLEVTFLGAISQEIKEIDEGFMKKKAMGKFHSKNFESSRE